MHPKLIVLFRICMVQLFNKTKVAPFSYLTELELTLYRSCMVHLFDQNRSCTVQLFDRNGIDTIQSC